MDKWQKELMLNRFIFEPQKYRGKEPNIVKENNDLNFCRAFFRKNYVDEELVKQLLEESILNKNNEDLDLILMLLEHFNMIKQFNITLAKLLVQPWHHFHDRIAGDLEFNVSDNITEYLYNGALYTCDNLEYESDYCGFNKKCLYALAKIGTKEAINYINKVKENGNSIVANYANEILIKYNY